MYTGSHSADTAVQLAPATDTWWDGLLSDSRSVVCQLATEPVLPIAELRRRATEHAARLAISPEVDAELLTPLWDGLSELLEVAEEKSELHALTHIVVRYFTSGEDDDLASAFGLDDDIEVFNAAILAAGLTHLEIS